MGQATEMTRQELRDANRALRRLQKDMTYVHEAAQKAAKIMGVKNAWRVSMEPGDNELSIDNDECRLLFWLGVQFWHGTAEYRCVPYLYLEDEDWIQPLVRGMPGDVSDNRGRRRLRGMAKKISDVADFFDSFKSVRVCDYEYAWWLAGYMIDRLGSPTLPVATRWMLAAKQQTVEKAFAWSKQFEAAE